ncbi:MAG TPA: ferritin-like domain-containing protein [Albibacterium sp.]|nr:ferritin-like domain-containing protein [Flavobacterium sp.]HUH18534.1 ferritin-like domain-containing protein [Albibacterium sp.]
MAAEKKTSTSKTTGSKATNSKTTNSKASGTKSDSKQSSISQQMKDSEFHQFFLDELKDIYWAEKHLAKALPKLQKAATSKELAQAFEKHTQETETHIKTIEKVFELLGEKATAKKCDAMEGLIEEANSVISDTDKGTAVRDAGLILSAQKAEHYEIATYGTLRTFAEKMGHEEVTSLLQQTLDNEKETDVALTEIAVNFVNEEASEE